MLTDSETQLLIEEKSPIGLRLAAGISAVLITALLLGGYAYVRKRHAEQTAAAQGPVQSLAEVPRGPAKAHILVDEALMQGGKSLVGGTVKNISSQELTDLSVELELHRRKDASVEHMALPLDPSALQPGQEGRYSTKLAARNYSSVRLTGLKSGADTTIVYTSALGQKRPLERLEPKVVTVPRPRSRPNEFLNSPDKPARVP